MKVIYQPKGRALEYAPLALNIYNGCLNGCRYCYCPKIAHKKPEDFWSHVSPRKNIIGKVRNELSQYRGQKILLSFLSDPYPDIEEDLCITHTILLFFRDHGVRPIVLTKKHLAMRDFDLIKQSNGEFATTLTFISNTDSFNWEPRASSPDRRFECLREAKKNNISTWVSLEPVIDPEQTLQIIDRCHEYVDLFKVGKLNYMKEANDIDWKKFLIDAEKKLKQYNCKYYIKKDLEAYR